MRMKRLQILMTLTVALLLAAGAYFVPAAPAATMGPVTDPVGVVKGNKGKRVTIAYWLVVAGPDAPLGVDSRRGIEIAVDNKRRALGSRSNWSRRDTGVT